MASIDEQNSADRRVADAQPGNWVDLHAPAEVRPYLRLMRADRPIGAWLLAIPGWQAIALAGGWADWNARDGQLVTFGWLAMVWVFLAFALGAVVMRGAGCVLNDLVDQDIDAKVARTASRPLPAGAVTRQAATMLLIALCCVGLLILSTFNIVAVWVGLASVLPIGVYPIMKRITWWPQAVLGVAFGWGALLGWAAMTGGMHAPALALYLGAICWVIGYDTIYAHQDREDDAIIGVKSTARLFGESTPLAMMLFYGLAIAFAALAGLLAGLGYWFWIGLVAYGLHLAGQIARLDINNPSLCLHLFKSNRDAGLILCGAILLGSL